MSGILAIESGSETEHITLDHSYANLNETSSFSKPGSECKQREDSLGNKSNAFESENVLDFHIKEEENDADLAENWTFIGRFSRVDDTFPEQVTLLDGEREVPSQEVCIVKQEEFEEDDGIIKGFSHDSGHYIPQNKHDNEEQLEGNLEDNQSQVWRFLVTLK